MGKRKTKGNNEKFIKAQKNDKEINYEKTQNFLCNAISDISGHVNILDTKVSIIMAALGVIISKIIDCRQSIYDTYKSIQECSMLNALFYIVLFGFVIAVILVYFWGLQIVKTHVCNIGFKSLWFITEKREVYSFETYKADVEKLNQKDIVENLSAELYKLNDIYRQKALNMRKTVVAFTAALILSFIGMLFCIFVST